MSDTRRGFLRRALGATLVGPAAVRAAMTARTPGPSVGLGNFLGYCADANATPLVNVPHLPSDELIEWMADRALTVAAGERHAFVEYANEAWNRRRATRGLIS